MSCNCLRKCGRDRTYKVPNSTHNYSNLTLLCTHSRVMAITHVATTTPPSSHMFHWDSHYIAFFRYRIYTSTNIALSKGSNHTVYRCIMFWMYMTPCRTPFFQWELPPVHWSYVWRWPMDCTLPCPMWYINYGVFVAQNAQCRCG